MLSGLGGGLRVWNLAAGLGRWPMRAAYRIAHLEAKALPVSGSKRLASVPAPVGSAAITLRARENPRATVHRIACRGPSVLRLRQGGDGIVLVSRFTHHWFLDSNRIGQTATSFH
jgi:hypothetical protein